MFNFLFKTVKGQFNNRIRISHLNKSACLETKVSEKKKYEIYIFARAYTYRNSS